jgi:transcriptional regulator with XRE-family HTH domain
MLACMSLVSPNQIHIGRVSLGWSMSKLADMAGCSANTVRAIEQGSDYRSSTIRSLAETMMNEGIRFSSDGEVSQRMEWPDGQRPETAEMRGMVLAILNAQRKAAGKCDYEDNNA